MTHTCMILFIDNLVDNHMQTFRAISLSLNDDFFKKNSFLHLYVVTAKKKIVLIFLDLHFDAL